MTEKPTATLLAAERLLSAQTGHWRPNATARFCALIPVIDTVSART